MPTDLIPQTADHHSRLLAACLGVAIRTLHEMEPDPERRRHIARNMAEALMEHAEKEPAHG